MSAEADLFPLNRPELADLIGKHRGRFAVSRAFWLLTRKVLSERTATLPSGWRSRLVRVSNPNTRGIVGLCLEVHDLAISKYIAGREKDLEFTRELVKQNMTEASVLLERLVQTENPDGGQETRRKLAYAWTTLSSGAVKAQSPINKSAVGSLTIEVPGGRGSRRAPLSCVLIFRVAGHGRPWVSRVASGGIPQARTKCDSLMNDFAAAKQRGTTRVVL